MSRCTNELLCATSVAIREAELRKKNFVMAWIDYKKTYMVLHLCVVECLNMFGEAEKIKPLFNIMEKWGVICAGDPELGEVNIWRSIFPGDSLSLMTFVLETILSLILRKTKSA